MPLPNLRRLRRDIDTQSQQLEHDIEHLKLSSARLRHTAVARVTSPLGLLSTLGAGFLTGRIAGKIAGRPSVTVQPSHSQQLNQRAIGHIAALILSTARAIGMQVLLPMAIEWVQSKFAQSDTESKKQ